VAESEASTTWLSPTEIEELTARKRWSAQCRVLAAMNIPFRPNAVGRPLVERSSVLQSTQKKKPAKGPNWGAMNGKAA